MATNVGINTGLAPVTTQAPPPVVRNTRGPVGAGPGMGLPGGPATTPAVDPSQLPSWAGGTLGANLGSDYTGTPLSSYGSALSDRDLYDLWRNGGAQGRLAGEQALTARFGSMEQAAPWINQMEQNSPSAMGDLSQLMQRFGISGTPYGMGNGAPMDLNNYIQQWAAKTGQTQAQALQHFGLNQGDLDYQTSNPVSVAVAGGAPPAGATTMPGMPPGQGATGTESPSATAFGTLGNMANMPAMQEAAGNYTGGQDMSQYLNPMAGWAQQQGLKGMQATYAGSPVGLQSGAAMKGISDYLTNSSINNAWQPAFQNYMADKGFNYGVDTGDRNFAYQAQLNDQTIPWQQQMQLAQLGMQGTQGASGLQGLLASLLSQNTANLGQLQGTGTIGGANNISSALQQIISQYLQSQMLNRIPGLNPPTT
jgi:hypothetical protein